MKRRQKVRFAIIFVSFLVFPVTINYFSPYLIVQGAFEGFINGSFLMFAFLFASSLFVGRAWCGWVCPGAGLQEACFNVRSNPAYGKKADWIKYGIWVPWLGFIIFGVINSGGYHTIDPFYMMETGISVTDPMNYVIYYIVVGLIVVLALTAGKRGFCHYVCWMAPFVIVGRSIRNLVGWPSLQLKVDNSKCKQCASCSYVCPMSLDVDGMVKSGNIENIECILCGTCVDTCPNGAIKYILASDLCKM